MKIEPVGKYTEPEYPTRDRFALQPELLGEYVPSVWRSKKLVAGALTAFVLGGTTKFCLSEKAAAAEQSQNSDASAKAPSFTEKPDQQKASVSVAPIFVHGGGSGAEGCDAISPPVYISEAEARKFISRELEKENITFDKTDVEIPEIVFDKTVESYEKVGDKYQGLEKPTGEQTTFVLDGFNTKLKLGYEFVSTGDFSDLVGTNPSSMFIFWNLKSLAEEIRAKLNDYGKMNAVVFYDPMVLAYDPEVEALMNKRGVLTEEERKQIEADGEKRDVMNHDEYIKAMQKRAEEELTAQVRDFIDWLKKEKILDKATE
jgi:hypothetical protein